MSNHGPARAVRLPALALALSLAACKPASLGEQPGVPPDPPRPLKTPSPVNPRTAIVEALLCAEPDPLAALRDLAEDPAAAADAGLAVSRSDGQGLDERIDVTASPPLVLPMGSDQAQVVRISQSFDSPLPGFHALVFAEVQGDPDAAIAALGLRPGAEHPGAIADWVRVAGKDAGEDETVCPDMVGLQIIGPGRYLLGCGWCNG